MKLSAILLLGILTIACASVDGPERDVASDEKKSETRRNKTHPTGMYDHR